MASLLAVPGLASTSAAFRARLYSLAVRGGWNPDAIAAVISTESRFNPRARSGTSSAVGLLQWVAATARLLGTNAEALLRMTAEEQLDVVERFYQRMLPGRAPKDPAAYYLVNWGRGDLADAPDEHVVWRAGSPEYDANRAVDRGSKGYLTVGDLKAPFRETWRAAGGARLPATLLGAELGTRAAVVREALAALRDPPSPDEVWGDVAPALRGSGAAWCGGFALWVLRRAGVLDGVPWEPGRGFCFRLPVTSRPEPGDVAYFHAPYQHHALVVSVGAEGVVTVDGNQPGVRRRLRALEDATAYYSIADHVRAPARPPTSVDGGAVVAVLALAFLAWALAQKGKARAHG